MKKLIFNGCSYTAGDALVWDQFCPEISWTTSLWKTAPSAELVQKYVQYRTEYRPKHNLAAMCAAALGTEKIDLSTDGNVNSRIALETINYILSLRPSARKEYHVCIGWTETSRRLKWYPNKNQFECIHVAHAENDAYAPFKNYIKEEIILNTDVDHAIHYLKDVMLLENFLKCQGMTYTFWRALGGRTYLPKGIAPILKVSENISDNDNWISFNQQDSLRINGTPWLATLRKFDDFISAENGHPNIQSVAAHANKVCGHISKYS